MGVVFYHMAHFVLRCSKTTTLHVYDTIHLFIPRWNNYICIDDGQWGHSFFLLASRYAHIFHVAYMVWKEKSIPVRKVLGGLERKKPSWYDAGVSMES